MLGGPEACSPGKFLILGVFSCNLVALRSDFKALKFNGVTNEGILKAKSESMAIIMTMH